MGITSFRAICEVIHNPTKLSRPIRAIWVNKRYKSWICEERELSPSVTPSNSSNIIQIGGTSNSLASVVILLELLNRASCLWFIMLIISESLLLILGMKSSGRSFLLGTINSISGSFLLAHLEPAPFLLSKIITFAFWVLLLFMVLAKTWVKYLNASVFPLPVFPVIR